MSDGAASPSPAPRGSIFNSGDPLAPRGSIFGGGDPPAPRGGSLFNREGPPAPASVQREESPGQREETPAEEKVDPSIISITVRDGNNDMCFKMKRDRPLKKLKETAAMRLGKDPTSCRFMMDGQRVMDTHTPDEVCSIFTFTLLLRCIMVSTTFSASCAVLIVGGI